MVCGVYNTYYLPREFVHESFKDQGVCYKYVLVKEDVVRKENWEKIYEEEITESKLYRNPECEW